MTKNEIENKKKIEDCLEIISGYKENVRHRYDELTRVVSEEEMQIVIQFLDSFGILNIYDNEFSVKSEVALLFIKSYLEFLKHDKKIVHGWESRDTVSENITIANVFNAANFLSGFEFNRKEVLGDSFIPVKSEDTVRVILVRKFLGKKYYLLQYDGKVGSYQMIGGIVARADKETRNETVLRKLKNELSGIDYNDNMISLGHPIYTTENKDEEVFLSKKFSVYACYKTSFYDIKFKRKIKLNEVKKINDDNKNAWLTYGELKKGKTHQGKSVFPLNKNVLPYLKGMDANFIVEKIDFDFIIKSAGSQLLLFVFTILGGIAAIGTIMLWIINGFSL